MPTWLIAFAAAEHGNRTKNLPKAGPFQGHDSLVPREHLVLRAAPGSSLPELQVGRFNLLAMQTVLQANSPADEFVGWRIFFRLEQASPPKLGKICSPSTV